MKTKPEQENFDEYVDRKFNETTKYSSTDDLIEFAFGDLETAVSEFERLRGKRYETKEEYLEDEYFFGFVSDEFDDVSVYATEEETAEWAFGSVEEAVDEYKSMDINED